jgi:hypothetical protein
MSANTVRNGQAELERDAQPAGQVHQPGAERNRVRT